MINGAYRAAKRIVIAVVGGTVLLFGVIMLVTPGPGWVAIAAGLGILAVEFAWARVWLKRLRQKMSEAGERLRGRDIDQHRDADNVS